MEDRQSKSIRTEGQSQGGIDRNMGIAHAGTEEWEEIKEEMRDSRVPFVIIQGINQKRGVQASKIQDVMGECYLWDLPKKLPLGQQQDGAALI